MQNVDEVLTRGVAEILPSREALAALIKKTKIKVYLGIDPSNSQIHIGNAVALRKLSQLQELGHKIILLIGDFTGMIGDPTDKSAQRRKLTKSEVLENAKTYKEQASKILRFSGPNAAEIKFNSAWLDKLSSAEWIELISNFTLQQLEERDMFVNRKKANKPIHMHELVYPMMQAYDSVVLEVNLEVGGTDQTFNMLAGRHLLKTLKNKEKFILTVPLLLGINGQKMGKSADNFIAIDDNPTDMFGKVMSINDDLIPQYFELATNLEIDSVELSNPMVAKKRLAFEIVKIYHGEKEAKSSQEKFESVFQRKETSSSAPEIISHSAELSAFLQATGLTRSMSEAKRLINEGAVEINGKLAKNAKTILKTGQHLRIGKKKFVKVKIEE